MSKRSIWPEVATVAAFCAFLFFFGLGAIGLTGADEPRYAQIAREMLGRHDWVTPVLYGKPWLEKPILYYWEAILAYKVFGVSDWAARLPAAVSATAMLFAIVEFMRRIRPEAAMDAALMTAASAACIGFSHAASTDMPLAAMFTIAMLCWFRACTDAACSVSVPAENKAALMPKRISPARLPLLGFYFFIALATLAKGPVAPGLAALIVLSYVAVARRWNLIAETLWWPGIVLFLAVAAPWYIAVQRANPQFAREFFLQQNLARFGTNLYRHKQPFWYYVPVLLAALTPWTIFAIASFIAAAKKLEPQRARRNTGSELRLFLLFWAVVPVLFFSISQSKLPGYILPAIPAWTLLLATHIATRPDDEAPGWPTIIVHSVLAAALVPIAFLLPAITMHQHLAAAAIVAAISAGVALLVAIVLTLRRRGLRMLRLVTIAAVILALAYVIRFDAPGLDAKLSTRILAAQISGTIPPRAPVAVFHMRREVEYGLAFYLDQPIPNYDRSEVPAGDHLVIAGAAAAEQLKQSIGNRRLSKIAAYPPQDLELYWVSGASGPKTPEAQKPASMTH